MRHFKISIFLLCSAAALLVSGCGGSGASSTTISGTVTGLTPDNTVGLLNNGTQAIRVVANGSFVFSGQVKAGETYNVTVSTNPVGQTCTVTNGAGTAGKNSIDVSNVLVTCVANWGVIFGHVSGLAAGNTVALLNTFGASNGWLPPELETISISANGPFVFTNEGSRGLKYAVTVSIPPSGQTCSVENGTNVIPASGGIPIVLVKCN